MISSENSLKNTEEIESLNNEIDYLKEILVSKIFEEDRLNSVTCRDIEIDYALKFGVYKYKIKDYKLRIKKTKRTIQLIKKMVEKQENSLFNKDLDELEANQIKINQTKINKPKINMKEIEDHIENEFKQEDIEVESETARVNILIDEHKNNLNKKIPQKELDFAYKDCIRKLHPDVLYDANEYEETLFFNAKEAYEDKDLNELQSCQTLIELHKISHVPETIDELEDYSKKLEIHIELEEMEISKIINSKPYTQQKFLLDQKKVNNYREGLVKSLLEVEKEYIKYKRELSELKKENNLTYKLDLTKGQN